LPSIYQLKPKFQALLRPLAKQLHNLHISANHVTIFASLSSLAVAFIVWQCAGEQKIFFLIPIFMFIRMALNALDGMLAREFNQKSDLGAYLNELGDIISDTALYLVFVVAASVPLVIAVVILSIISEYAGVMSPLVGVSRRYDGPMGKSDRAFVFGVLGFMIAIDLYVFVIDYILWGVVILLVLTTLNRVKNGVNMAKKGRETDGQ